jgi:hypothetical protein
MHLYSSTAIVADYCVAVWLFTRFVASYFSNR